MAFNVENTSGAPLDINDLGITLAIGEITDLALRTNPETVAISANGGDLDTLITAGGLTVKDPIDGTTNLSVADGIAVARSHNETHWRVGAGARLGDISDVDLVTTPPNVDDVLTFDGSDWVPGAAGASLANNAGFSTVNGQEIFSYDDPNRSNKRISTDSHSYQFFDVTLTDQGWVSLGTVTDADIGWIMPLDGTVVGISAMTENADGNTFEIHLFKNDLNHGPVATLTGTDVNTSIDATLNFDFEQGDRLRLQALRTVGTGIGNDVSISLMIRWGSREITWELDNANSLEASFSVITEDILPKGAQWNNDGTKLYVAGNDTSTIYQYPVETPWNVGSALGVESTLDISTENTAISDLFWKDDGTKLYVIGISPTSIHQYPVTTPFDISTAGAVEFSFGVGTEESVPSGLAWKTDGTKVYITGSTIDNIHQYPVSTPWDLSTAGSVEASFPFVGIFAPTGIFWKSDGTKLFVIDLSENDITQLPVSTPWDVSTIGTQETTFSLSPITPTISERGISFKPDGSKFYVVDEHTNFNKAFILQFSIPQEFQTAWNLNYVRSVESSFSVSAQDSVPTGMDWKPDGTKVYMIGNITDTVYQYPVTTPWDISTAGTVEASFSVTTENTEPRGLIWKNDGTKLYITGTSPTSVHQYPVTTPFDISTAGTVEASFGVGGEDPAPHEVMWKSDGFKLYVLGNTGDIIFQYPVTTPWDISTAGAVEAFFDFSAEETGPTGFFWRFDGKKIYIIGTSSDSIHQYPVTTPWDISTVGTVEASFDVSGEETSPHGIIWKPDGSKLYIIGISSDSIRQYPIPILEP